MLSLGRNWDLLWAIKMSWEPTSSKNVCEKETVEERNVKNMVSFWTSCLFFFSSVGHACQKLCSRARETQRGIQGELHCTLVWCITQFKVLQHLLYCLILPIGAFWAPTIDKKTGFLNIRACLESYLVELGLKILPSSLSFPVILPFEGCTLKLLIISVVGKLGWAHMPIRHIKEQIDS